MELRESVFEVDGYIEDVRGYHTYARERCGYPVPCFELAEALEIMEQVNNSVDFYDLWDWNEPISYDADTDTFINAGTENGEEFACEPVRGEVVTIEGRSVVVYWLGNWPLEWNYAS